MPEDQRVTATKKRHELLVLRNEILTRKSNFNAYLLALRDRKKQLLEKVRVTLINNSVYQYSIVDNMHIVNTFLHTYIRMYMLVYMYNTVCTICILYMYIRTYLLCHR